MMTNYAGNNSGGYSDANLRTFAEMTGLFLSDFDSCMSSGKYLKKIEADFDAGVAAGVNSTPTFFINGEEIPGLVPYGEFRVKIEKALAEAGS